MPLQCSSAAPANIERWQHEWQKAGITISRSTTFESNPQEAEKARFINQKLCTGRLTDFTGNDKPLSNIIFKDLKEAITIRYPNHTEQEKALT